MGVSQSSLLAVQRRVGFGLHRNHNNSTSIICCSIRRLPKLRSSWGFGDRSDQRQGLLAAAPGAVSSDPLKASTTVTVDSIQPDTVTGGGDGDGFGNRGGGGGDNNNNNNEKGEGGSDESSKKMSGMSMSQKLTLAYAALVGGKGPNTPNFTFKISSSIFYRGFYPQNRLR